MRPYKLMLLLLFLGWACGRELNVLFHIDAVGKNDYRVTQNEPMTPRVQKTRPSVQKTRLTSNTIMTPRVQKTRPNVQKTRLTSKKFQNEMSKI